MHAPRINIQRQVDIIGAASCWGARDMRCNLAPDVMRKLSLDSILHKKGLHALWREIVRPDPHIEQNFQPLPIIENVCSQLSTQVSNALQRNHQFLVIGGDHSCAIGTWSGVHQTLGPDASFGLIWIDAHMDAHTDETSPSGAIHGMPVATLLGHGAKPLTQLASPHPKIAPENLCLIGIRSYEAGEKELLKSLGVKVFFMDDVHRLGLNKVMTMAIKQVSKNTVGFGVSIDLDAIDPNEAPGVGSPTSHGLSATELADALKQMRNNLKLLGVEIAELNTVNDRNFKTAEIALSLVDAIW
jgi:arginase